MLFRSDPASNLIYIKKVAAQIRTVDGLNITTSDLVDDGGAYNAAWCDTVVTMCNELKSDLNLVLAALQGVTK